VSEDGDAFGPLEVFFEDPLGDGVDMPAFITFPSTKVSSHSIRITK
jgi:hypothetical protein